MLFSSLLPGFRDLRTPLTTGYLYGLLVWLIVDRDALPSHEDVLTKRVIDLSDYVGVAGTLGAASFACYLVGSILTIRRFWLPDYLQRLPVRFRRYYGDRPTERSYILWCHEQATRIVKQGGTASALTSNKELSSSWLTSHLEAAREMARESKETVDYSQLDEYDEVQLLSMSLRVALRDEWDGIITRLQIERETIWNEYDRLRAESELRFSIFPPLVMLVIVAAVAWSPWAAAIAILPVALLLHGKQLEIQSNERIEHSLIRGVVTAPFMLELQNAIDKLQTSGHAGTADPADVDG